MSKKHDTAKQRKSHQPIRGDKGASLIGPSNPAREAESPSRLSPPSTDHGTLPNLKWSFADSHNRLEAGGWARQTTIREMPIATELAGVNMRLEAGAIRELHWHKEGEWAYMLKGRARVTSVDQDLHAYQDDVGEGEGWFFPAGIPHSIQGFGGGGLRVPSCLRRRQFQRGRNLPAQRLVVLHPEGRPREELRRLRERLRQHPREGALHLQVKGARPHRQGQGRRPRALPAWPHPPDVLHGADPHEVRPSAHPGLFRLSGHNDGRRIGRVRELHWHPNADEWQYYLSGEARMTIFASSGRAQTFDYQARDVGYVPRAMPHYVKNTGATTLRFLEMFRSPRFQDVPLAQWLAFTPHELVRAHLNTDESVLAKIPPRKVPVVGP